MPTSIYSQRFILSVILLHQPQQRRCIKLQEFNSKAKICQAAILMF